MDATATAAAAVVVAVAIAIAQDPKAAAQPNDDDEMKVEVEHIAPPVPIGPPPVVVAAAAGGGMDVGEGAVDPPPQEAFVLVRPMPAEPEEAILEATRAVHLGSNRDDPMDVDQHHQVQRISMSQTNSCFAVPEMPSIHI